MTICEAGNKYTNYRTWKVCGKGSDKANFGACTSLLSKFTPVHSSPALGCSNYTRCAKGKIPLDMSKKKETKQTTPQNKQHKKHSFVVFRWSTWKLIRDWMNDCCISVISQWFPLQFMLFDSKIKYGGHFKGLQEWPSIKWQGVSKTWCIKVFYIKVVSP